MNGMRVSIAEAAGKPNKASTWQGGKMKKVLAIVAIAVLAMLLAPAEQGQRMETVYTVQPGDTLWGIAEAYCGDKYILMYLDDLERLNPGLTADIRPGQKIRVTMLVDPANPNIR